MAQCYVTASRTWRATSRMRGRLASNGCRRRHLAPELPTGLVRLYEDASWNSQSLDLPTSQYRQNARQSIAGTYMQDAATWVAFNLPVGTVMTLMNNDTRSYQNIEGWGNTHQIDNFSAAT